MTTYPDETLNFWGDVFAGSPMAVDSTFEQFLALPVPMRQRKLAAAVRCELLDFTHPAMLDIVEGGV